MSALRTIPNILKITLVKSPIHAKPHIRGAVRALGLKKLNQFVYQKNTPETLGQIYTAVNNVAVEEIPLETLAEPPQPFQPAKRDTKLKHTRLENTMKLEVETKRARKMKLEQEQGKEGTTEHKTSATQKMKNEKKGKKPS